MAWRIVVQPDGKYATFSDVVDNFTLFNMSREEAVDYCFTQISDGELHYQEQCRRLGVKREVTKEPLWRYEAEGKVLRADLEPGRWAEELETVKNIHGKKGVEEVLGYVKRADSHWPMLRDELQKECRFKKDDTVKTRLDGTVVKIKEVLPNQWYLVEHPKGHDRWKDWELEKATS